MKADPGRGGLRPAGRGNVRRPFDKAPTLERNQRRLISSAAIGSANRGRVLKLLFDLGPSSRAELARHLGVNRATIGGIIQPLLDQALLAEGDPMPSSEGGGKPAKPLWFSNDASPICAVVLMHDAVHTALVSLNGAIQAERRATFPRRPAGVDAIMRTVIDCVTRTLSATPRPPLGIGVAAAGMVDTDHGLIVTVNLAPMLDGFAVGPELTQRFGLPACVDHHPRALLVGDRWFGVGRGRRRFAAIYTGDVLGGALLLDDHLYRGPGGAGGELGHTFVQVDGAVCRCGRRGCWETIATLGWLRREASAYGLPSPETLDSKRLAELAGESEPKAVALLDRYARNIAVGIANLQQTMAPGFFVIHGDAAGGGPRLLDGITEHVRRMVPSRPGGDIELILGDLADEAALRGAAGLVLSELLHFEL
jgi:predicted NBD/HSP70 family sugar kinase